MPHGWASVLRVVGLSLPLALGDAPPLASAPLAAVGPALPKASVQSIFRIEKSENRNQVHYAVRVDAACRPVGKQPVYAYWRNLEVGPKDVSPLLDHEQRAYGLTAPRSIRIRDDVSEIQIGLRGFPERRLTIQVFKVGERCAARTATLIRGEPALLSSIYIDIGFLFSVNYALVRGVRIADGKPVQEKVQ